MAIEFITPELVNINGNYVEIRDRREPDYFDWQNKHDNAQLQDKFTPPLQDIELNMPRSILLGGVIDPEVVAYQQIPRFIDMAQRAAKERAVSYRDFNVGASAYVISSSTQKAAYLFGANYTPVKGAPKRCAELEVVTKAKQRSFDRIVALAVFGPSDYGEVNEVVSPTLHPCEQCRNMLDQEPLIQDDTLLITGNSEGEIELMFVPDLLRLHG